MSFEILPEVILDFLIKIEPETEQEDEVEKENLEELEDLLESLEICKAIVIELNYFG